MTAIVKNLSRYPIKGLSPEALQSVELHPGRGFEGDRAFALALPDTAFDEADPTPLHKTMFLMLARQEALARLVTSYDAENGLISIKDGTYEFAADIRTRDGKAAVEEFFASFLPEKQSNGCPRLVSASGHKFTDVGFHSRELMESVSMINLASVRDLESKLGQHVDPRRFRANILVEGLPPWVELNWVDRTLKIGSVRFRGARLTTRCPATEVNPNSALRDIALPRELKHLYGHLYLGLYLHVLSEGQLAVGDVFEPPKEGFGDG